MSWHCVPSSSGSYCYWSPSYGWTTRVVNSRSLAVNVTHYDKAYKFDVVVITSRGRGEAYPLVVYIPPLNGIPGNFTCSVLKGGYYNSYLQCEWSKPTDVNPVGFYVSTISVCLNNTQGGAVAPHIFPTMLCSPKPLPLPLHFRVPNQNLAPSPPQFQTYYPTPDAPIFVKVMALILN